MLFAVKNSCYTFPLKNILLTCHCWSRELHASGLVTCKYKKLCRTIFVYHSLSDHPCWWCSRCKCVRVPPNISMRQVAKCALARINLVLRYGDVHCL